MAKKKIFDLVEFAARRDAAQSNRWLATIEEVKEAYKQGYRDFGRIFLQDGDLNHVTLKGSDFTESYLISINFDNCNLEEMDWQYAKLVKCNLHAASLVNSKLRYVHMINCGMEFADASHANFYHADIQETPMDNTELTGASFQYAEMRRTNFVSASCEKTDFSGADLAKSNFCSAILSNTRFNDADITNCTFENCGFENVDFLEAKGLYTVYGPNLSSRTDQLYGGVVIENGRLELRLWAGCQGPIEAEELLEAVIETHGSNVHARQYKAAIKCIQKMFKVDMEDGKWNYLLTLTDPSNTENN